MGCTCLTPKRKALSCYMIERKCCTNNIVQSGTDCGQITSERMSNIYGLLTKREVKMAEYWPSSFLRVYGKGTRPISSHLDRTSLVNKGFIIWLLLRLRGNFSCGTQRVIPSGQDSSILPARVANHSAGFGSSCPLTELAI